eukprot:TRINITY_DN911_c9_g1_i1.p1 TRINITY_DN911_c9_g1~~TRINITY_DN911_c9_g1_i1.p1  ORF type:complete len:304 (+),score=115.01 TRINITY_DN911_c9_g1_i1:51-962(+)
MSTFNDLFQEAQVKKTQKKEPKQTEKKEEKKAEKAVEPVKAHPKDDPAVRKARKERRKKQRTEQRKEMEAQDKKEDIKKVKRASRKEAWEKAREMVKSEEAALKEHEDVVEDAVEAVGRLQAMIACGGHASFRAIMDPSVLEETNIKIKNKRQHSINAACDILEKLAAGLMNSTVSPYIIASRLSNVANAFLTSFEPLLNTVLEPAEVKRIMVWIKDQRSFINKEKERLIQCSKDFVPSEVPIEPETDDKEEEEEAEEEAEDEKIEEEPKKKEKKSKESKKRPAEETPAPESKKAKKAKKSKK